MQYEEPLLFYFNETTLTQLVRCPCTQTLHKILGKLLFMCCTFLKFRTDFSANFKFLLKCQNTHYFSLALLSSSSVHYLQKDDLNTQKMFQFEAE